MKFFRNFIGLFLITLFFNCKQSSNEVLEAFSQINSKLENSNQSQNQKLDSLAQMVLSDTTAKLDFQIYKEKSEKLDSLLSSIKARIVAEVRLSSNSEFEFGKIDRIIVDSLFFNDDKPSQIGQKFVDYMNDFRVSFVRTYGMAFPDVVKAMEERFYTKTNGESDWLTYQFKGFPAIAAIAKLTLIQSHIKKTTQDLLEAILAKQ